MCLKKHVSFFFVVFFRQNCQIFFLTDSKLRPHCSLTLSPTSPLIFFSIFLVSHSRRFSFQASNGNDPWSVWNADPSRGSSNNWASNPEGTQTGKSAAGDPWGSVSQGHPQAYQGPGKNRCLVWNNGVSTLKLLPIIFCHLWIHSLLSDRF